MPYPNCTSCEINSGTCNPVMPVYPGGRAMATKPAGMVGIVPQGPAHYPALSAPRGPGFQAYTKAVAPIAYAAGPWRATEPQKMIGRGDTSYQFASPSQVIGVVPPFFHSTSGFDPWEQNKARGIKSAGQVSVSMSSGTILLGLAAVAGAVWYANKRKHRR